MRKLQFLLNKTFKLGRYTFSFLINKNKYLPKLKYFDFIKIIFTFGMKVFFFVQVAAIIIYYLITLNFSEFFSYLISNISSMYESIGNMFSNLFNFNKNIENSVDTVKDEVKNPSKTDLSNVKRVNIDELNEKEKQKRRKKKKRKRKRKKKKTKKMKKTKRKKRKIQKKGKDRK